MVRRQGPKNKPPLSPFPCFPAEINFLPPCCDHLGRPTRGGPTVGKRVKTNLIRVKTNTKRLTNYNGCNSATSTEDNPLSGMSGTEPFDLFIVGGGVNGCGVAGDAAGRGLTVALAEQGDLAQATSFASTKLFHGGLRYLEYFEFRLVREALKERETLLVAMPHISWPMRFVLPYSPDMRFESDTPTSRLLDRFMPWVGRQRPAWLIRLGLFLYDTLGGRKILPPTRMIDLRRDEAGTSRYSNASSAPTSIRTAGSRTPSLSGSTPATRPREARGS